MLISVFHRLHRIIYNEVQNTPCGAFCSVVNRDVMDAVDTGQVDPPGSGFRAS